MAKGFRDRAALTANLEAKDFVRGKVLDAAIIKQATGVGDDRELVDEVMGYQYWHYQIAEVNNDETALALRTVHVYVETATGKAFYKDRPPVATIQPPPVVAAVETPEEDPILE